MLGNQYLPELYLHLQKSRCVCHDKYASIAKIEESRRPATALLPRSSNRRQLPAASARHGAFLGSKHKGESILSGSLHMRWHAWRAILVSRAARLAGRSPSHPLYGKLHTYNSDLLADEVRCRAATRSLPGTQHALSNRETESYRPGEGCQWWCAGLARTS
jgi:hypothetical protein